MRTQEQSTYRGYFITTRSGTSERRIDSVGVRFTASFCVDPGDPCRPSWQQFPKAAFGTMTAACRHALEGAKTSIDQDIAVSGPWGDAPQTANRR
jgi:hypothetical protein